MGGCRHCNHLQKGDRPDCGNYRGISFLCIAGKIFARILLNILSTHVTPEVVPETQCGFRGIRNTVNMIFCLRQLQEKCIEQNRPMYMVFVDFSNAFDTVGRTGLWQLLRKYGCSEKFTTMIEALHIGMVLYQPNSTRTLIEDIMVDGNKLNSILEFTYLESTISSNGCMTMNYRGGWLGLLHISTDYAIDSGTTTMCPCVL